MKTSTKEFLSLGRDIPLDRVSIAGLQRYTHRRAKPLAHIVVQGPEPIGHTEDWVNVAALGKDLRPIASIVVFGEPIYAVSAKSGPATTSSVLGKTPINFVGLAIEFLNGVMSDVLGSFSQSPVSLVKGSYLYMTMTPLLLDGLLQRGVNVKQNHVVVGTFGEGFGPVFTSEEVTELDFQLFTQTLQKEVDVSVVKSCSAVLSNYEMFVSVCKGDPTIEEVASAFEQDSRGLSSLVPKATNITSAARIFCQTIPADKPTGSH